MSTLESTVVTLDGPAGAGKSSVARALADRFGFAFLDTGAMYRAITLACLRAGIDWSDERAIGEVAERSEICLAQDRVYLEGEDISEAIRTAVINEHIGYVADLPGVRQRLGELQRAFASGKQIVTEGRDQGTEIFPDADCKIFLTAQPMTRARRRHAQLVKRNPDLTVEDVLAAQDRRDEDDAKREVGGLRPAADAEIFYTDDLTEAQVVDALAAIVQARTVQRR